MALEYWRLFRHYVRTHGGLLRSLLRLTIRIPRLFLIDSGIQLRSAVSQYRALYGRVGTRPGGSGTIVSMGNERPLREYSDGEVDVIVCVHNAPTDVEICLDAVLQHRSDTHRIIVVDDGSDEVTRALLQRKYAMQPRVHILRNEAALGYTFAANIGLRHSHAPFVVLLNSDTIVTRLWTEGLLRCLESSERCGAVSPLSNCASWQSLPELEENGDWAVNRVPRADVASVAKYVRASSARSYPVLPFLNGFCLLLRRAMLDEIGVFNEMAFGAGYGEENDLCLRATQAGWLLAVADDTYVYHSQSKSYSTERRKKLYALADAALKNLHGETALVEGAGLCRRSLILASARARARQWPQVRAAHVRAHHFAGKRIAFVLPSDRAGGGSNVVVEEARCLRAAGLDVTLVNLESYRAGFEMTYPHLDVRRLYISSPSDLQRLAGQYNALIATLYATMYWLQPVATAQDVVIGYYVQDYEPRFFPVTHPERDRARASYTLIPGARLFTKTKWNAAELRRQVGLEVPTIGVSLGSRGFGPKRHEATGAPIRIVAMVRLASDYRAPRLTIEILKQIAARFGDRIAIRIFGTDSSELQPFALGEANIENLGICTPAQIADLLGSTDIFADFSAYQAMGLTALEAMLSGAAVIVPQNGGASEFCAHLRHGLVVDTTNAAECLAAVARLIEDAALRRRLAEAAMEQAAAFRPELSAARMLEVLFPARPHTNQQ